VVAVSFARAFHHAYGKNTLTLRRLGLRGESRQIAKMEAVHILQAFHEPFKSVTKQDRDRHGIGAAASLNMFD